jgi:hypothetical protein
MKMFDEKAGTPSNYLYLILFRILPSIFSPALKMRLRAAIFLFLPFRFRSMTVIQHVLNIWRYLKISTILSVRFLQKLPLNYRDNRKKYHFKLNFKNIKK